MIDFKHVTALHMEFSTRCNARCPLCPRNQNGFPYNGGYKETDLNLELVKQRLTPSFVLRLRLIKVNGNFGDFVMNMQSLDILRYFRSINNKMIISISTNGGARDKSFWQAIAQPDINADIEFCLDGLEDTHHLYRQDTSFEKVLENAGHFIAAGGKAVWKMIKFNHNLHQTDECRELSKTLGFSGFTLIDHGRSNGTVFDRDGSISHVIGNPKDYAFKSARGMIKSRMNPIPYKIDKEYDTSIAPACFVKKARNIYISAEGKVYPCCWVGHSPETYNMGQSGWLNKQIAPLVADNDLNEHDLETCIQWFSKVEDSWSKNSYEDGRLRRCDTSCGTCTNK
jgi:MoaA/NifB/PqqE/SkfB family radical SAM enzyme